MTQRGSAQIANCLLSSYNIVVVGEEAQVTHHVEYPHDIVNREFVWIIDRHSDNKDPRGFRCGGFPQWQNESLPD